MLILLEELEDPSKIDWNYLLQGLPDLSILQHIDFPPLYREDAIEEVDGFLAIQNEPINEAPGQSFYRLEIYIAKDDIKKLLPQFDKLYGRLNNYEPLQEHIY